MKWNEESKSISYDISPCVSFEIGILKKESRVWSCNAVGVILGVYYFWAFTRYSPKSSPTLPGSVSQHAKSCFGIVLLSIMIAMKLPGEKAAAILGKMGAGFCIALFASPLAALKTVVQKKSAKSIPLSFTLATVVNCFLWSVVGVLDMQDVNIYLPCLMGLAIGIVEVLLKLLYGNGDGKPKMAV